MNSRRRVVLLGSAVVLAPRLMFAQQPEKIARIGFLNASSTARSAEWVEALRAGLRDLGYIEGKNILIEFRWADGDYARLPALAQELVGLKLDLILVNGRAAIRAAQQATTTIPIITPSVGDPVGSGFAKSLARPGGNITGVSFGEVRITKLLAILKESNPKLSHVALLSNPGNFPNTASSNSFQSDAKSIGIRILQVEASTLAQIERAFARMTEAGVQAIIISSEPFLNTQLRRIAELALSHHMASITYELEYPKAGGLMAYGSDIPSMYRRAATYVDKILKGAKPGDLPIEENKTFDMIINMKTAKALGLKIPDSILLQATKVIE